MATRPRRAGASGMVAPGSDAKDAVKDEPKGSSKGDVSACAASAKR